MNNAKLPPKILLYGSSILIQTLASKLQKIEGWEVKRIENGEIRELDRLNFVVTDLCDITASETLPMLSALPGVMLIGVDAIANNVTVLTGRYHPSNSLQAVLDALKGSM